MIAAVALASCEPTPSPEPDPTPEKLTASVTPSEITADGQSKAVFTVKYGEKTVFSYGCSPYANATVLDTKDGNFAEYVPVGP